MTLKHDDRYFFSSFCAKDAVSDRHFDAILTKLEENAPFASFWCHRGRYLPYGVRFCADRKPRSSAIDRRKNELRTTNIDQDAVETNPHYEILFYNYPAKIDPIFAMACIFFTI